MSQFEYWWLSQNRLKSYDDRLAARLGWTHAFNHTLLRMVEGDQKSTDYKAEAFKYRSCEPFYIGHNAAVDLLTKMLNAGDYPGYE